MPDVLAHSIPEAAKIAGVGRSFLYEEIRDGQLIARKAKGRTLILHQDLVDYLANLPMRKVADEAAA